MEKDNQSKAPYKIIETMKALILVLFQTKKFLKVKKILDEIKTIILHAICKRAIQFL